MSSGLSDFLASRSAKQTASSRKSGVLFSTPPRGGVGQHSVLRVPLAGRVFVHLRDSNAVCRGSVSNGSKVCFKLAGDCMDSAHKQSTLPVCDDTIYLRSAKSGSLKTVWSEYSFDASDLSEDLIAYFVHLEDEDSLPVELKSMATFLTNHGVRTLTDFREAAKGHSQGEKVIHQTPFKKRQAFELSPTSEQLLLGTSLEDTTAQVRSLKLLKRASTSAARIFDPTATKLGALVELAMGDPAQAQSAAVTVASRVDSLSYSHSALGTSTADFGQASSDQFGELDNAVLTLKNSLAEVKEEVGNGPSLDALDEDNLGDLKLGPTLWDSVLLLAQEVATSTANFVTQSDIDLLIKALSGDLHAVATGTYVPVMDEDGLDGVEKGETLADRLRDALQKLDLLTETVRLSGANSGVGRYLLGGRPVPRNTRDIRALFEFQGSLIGNPGFVPSPSCFVSPHMFLELVHRELMGTKLSSYSSAAQKEKVGMDFEDFYLVQGCMRNVPNLFLAGKLQAVRYSAENPNSEAHIKLFPTAIDFGKSTRPDTVYNLITKAIDSASTYLSSRIESKLELLPDLRTLCIEMLGRSKLFVQELFEYLSTMHEELIDSFPSDGHEAWDLVCFGLLEIFRTTLRPEREKLEGQGVTEALTPAGGSKLLYSSLCILDKVEEFLSVGIRHHPSLTSSMVRFVMLQSNRKELHALVTKAPKMESGIKELKDAIKLLTKSVKDVEEKNRSLQAQLDSVKQKLNARS